MVTRDLQEFQRYVKWALKVDIRLLLEGFYWMNKLNLQHLKKNAWLMDYLKTVLAVATGIYKAVSKRYWAGKVKPLEGFTAVPLGSSGTLSRRSPEMLFDYVSSLSDNRRPQQVVRKHLTTETVLFSSWGLWFLFLFRALYFRRHIRPCSHELDKGVLGEIERSWVQTIWKLSSGTTKKLVWVLYGRFGGWRCDETCFYGERRTGFDYLYISTDRRILSSYCF